MGTRFLLTSDSRVPDQIKRMYLAATVADTVVTSALDGVPQRLLRTPFADRLATQSRAASAFRSVRSAAMFRRLAGSTWRDLLIQGLQMHREHGLPVGHVLLAANTPALLRAAMVEGLPDFGVMAAGQVAGVIDDLPSCAELVSRIIAEADAVLARLIGAGTGPGRSGEETA
jgi:NAD(P)H-dependent flavin oxidoreductase YrpB (nitropropane dioxygenase family)